MKKNKKILMAVFACIVVCAISIPAIAANMQKTTVSVEQVVYTRNSGLNHVVLDKKVVYPNELEENKGDIVPVVETAPQDVPETEEAAGNEGNSIAAVDDPTTPDPAEDRTYTPETDGDGEVTDTPEEAPADVPEEVPADTPEEAPADVADTGVNDTAASPVCPYYVDNNGDGVCDHCAHGGSCGNYVDNNGDGICDYCAHGGACGNYVDANWDGVCDYCTHNGSGHCGNYSDSNGDGYCDNYVSTGSGSGHHGGGHHGGHHW